MHSPSFPGRPIDRAVLLILDSCGCGASPDAERYGDQGANTLANLSNRVGGVSLPNLAALGLGNITPIAGVPGTPTPRAAWGRMREQSAGKDTTTGHWEICGLQVDSAFPTYTDGFPKDFIDRFVARTGRGILGNYAASGTQIIEELGAEHARTGKWIVYTSADSVFQIAAHEGVIPLPELYEGCQIARALCDEFGVGRVIARPFVGSEGAYKRTYNRRDYSLPPPQETVLDRLAGAGLPVVGVGKISDIFATKGVTQDVHTEGNLDGMEHTLRAFSSLSNGLVFCNLVDFDMLYGHRRDSQGYAKALEAFDAFVPRLCSQLTERDLVIFTADHGNDPTHPGSDHTREEVPVLAFSKNPPRTPELGLRLGFYDVAATLCQAFGVGTWERGQSFLDRVLS